jgi:hypothetical protein
MPARLTALHSHSAPSAQPAERRGVAVSGGKIAPMLPANATAIAAFAHHTETQ